MKAGAYITVNTWSKYCKLERKIVHVLFPLDDCSGGFFVFLFLFHNWPINFCIVTNATWNYSDRTCQSKYYFSYALKEGNIKSHFFRTHRACWKSRAKNHVYSKHLKKKKIKQIEIWLARILTFLVKHKIRTRHHIMNLVFYQIWYTKITC